jgi:hypothetical protein
MRQNLYTDKNFLSNSARYRVWYMKKARIFQQCANSCEKQDKLTALRLNKNHHGTSNNRKFDMKTTIFLKMD